MGGPSRRRSSPSPARARCRARPSRSTAVEGDQVKDTATEGSEAPVGWKSVLTRPVMSWALYDLANTVFSMNIVSLYLSLWVLNVMGGTDTTWGYANSLAMALVFLTAPPRLRAVPQPRKRMRTMPTTRSGLVERVSLVLSSNIACHRGGYRVDCDCTFRRLETEGLRG